MSTGGWFTLTAAQSRPFAQILQEKWNRQQEQAAACALNGGSKNSPQPHQRSRTPTTVAVDFSGASRADIVRCLCDAGPRTMFRNCMAAMMTTTTSRDDAPGEGRRRCVSAVDENTKSLWKARSGVTMTDEAEFLGSMGSAARKGLYSRLPWALRNITTAAAPMSHYGHDHDNIDSTAAFESSSHLPQSEVSFAAFAATHDGDWMRIPKQRPVPLDEALAAVIQCGGSSRASSSFDDQQAPLLWPPAMQHRDYAAGARTPSPIVGAAHRVNPKDVFTGVSRLRKDEQPHQYTMKSRGAAARHVDVIHMRRKASSRKTAREISEEAAPSAPESAAVEAEGAKTTTTTTTSGDRSALPRQWSGLLHRAASMPFVAHQQGGLDSTAQRGSAASIPPLLSGEKISGGNGASSHTTKAARGRQQRAATGGSTAAALEVTCEPWPQEASTRTPLTLELIPNSPCPSVSNDSPNARREGGSSLTDTPMSTKASPKKQQLSRQLRSRENSSSSIGGSLSRGGSLVRGAARRRSTLSTSERGAHQVESKSLRSSAISAAAPSIGGRADPQVDKVGKYKWMFEQLLPAPTVPRPQFFAAFIDTVNASCRDVVNKVPENYDPTKKIALIVTVSCYKDPAIPSYPQAELDGAMCENSLLRAGFTVIALRSSNKDPTMKPTNANVTREVAKVLRWNEAGHYAALVIFFVARGTTRNVLLMSDTVLRLMACEDTKPNLSHTFFPLDLPVSRRMTNCITVADMAGLAASVPLHGFAFVHNETLGGYMTFEYSAVQPYAEWISASRGAVSLLFTRALRGKGTSDLRLTPNSINVFICERLMAQKFKVFTNSSPLQNGRWDILDHRVVLALRNTMRAFRLHKRNVTVAVKIEGFATEEYSRNLSTVASLITTRVKTHARCRMQNEYFAIQTIFSTGQVDIVFQTNESFTFGCIDVEAFCRRNFPFAEPVRQSSALRVSVMIQQVGIAASVAKLKAHVRAKSLPVTIFVGFEMHVFTTQRGERKLQWLMRMNRLVPFTIIDSIEIDKEQVHRLQAVAFIQRFWRCYVSRKRSKLATMLLDERSVVADGILAEWRELIETVRGRLSAASLEVLLTHEESARAAVEDMQCQIMWRHSREYVAGWAAIVIRGRGAYMAHRPLTLTEKIADVQWAELDESGSFVVLRNRMAIEHHEARGFFEINSDYSRSMLCVAEANAFRPLAESHETTTMEECGRTDVMRMEHEELLATVGAARRFLVIPPRLVKTSPFITTNAV